MALDLAFGCDSATESAHNWAVTEATLMRHCAWLGWPPDRYQPGERCCPDRQWAPRLSLEQAGLPGFFSLFVVTESGTVRHGYLIGRTVLGGWRNNRMSCAWLDDPSARNYESVADAV